MWCLAKQTWLSGPNPMGVLSLHWKWRQIWYPMPSLATHVITNHFSGKNGAREGQRPQKRNSPSLQGMRIRARTWQGFWGRGGHRIYSLKKNNLVNYFKLIYHSRVSHKKLISILFHFEAPSGISTGVHSCTTAIKNKAELCFMDNLFRRGAI